MRVLITGATGFVGRWLADEIVASHPDAQITGATFHHAGSLMPPFHALHAADLTQESEVRRVVREAKPDVVYHMAGFASGAGGDADMIFRTNKDSVVWLLSALRDENKPCRVLLPSSGYVYGATQPGRPAIETDDLKPQGVYAESKAAMESAAEPFADALSITLCRSFNHSGARQTPDFVVPAFAKQIAEIEREALPPVVRVGNLLAVRDFLHVRDVVRAYRLLLFDAPAVPLRVVNVASGQGVTIQSLLDTLVSHSTVELSVEPDPARMRPSDLPVCVGSFDRLREITAWQPLASVETMLVETLEYWRGATPR